MFEWNFLKKLFTSSFIRYKQMNYIFVWAACVALLGSCSKNFSYKTQYMYRVFIWL